jgi:hypothetical protein
MSYLIPFDPDGNLLSCARNGTLTNWVQNFEFEDTLRYVGYGGGRSAMSMKVESTTTGKKYRMFWAYFDKLIRRSDIQPGPTFTGKWTFVKKGKNYSIRPLGQTEC